ncbi:hypothetical protein ACA910_003562 [Epithemia clementina (nom. ined.)]
MRPSSSQSVKKRFVLAQIDHGRLDRVQPAALRPYMTTGQWNTLAHDLQKAFQPMVDVEFVRDRLPMVCHWWILASLWAAVWVGNMLYFFGGLLVGFGLLWCISLWTVHRSDLRPLVHTQVTQVLEKFNNHHFMERIRQSFRSHGGRSTTTTGDRRVVLKFELLEGEAEVESPRAINYDDDEEEEAAAAARGKKSKTADVSPSAVLQVSLVPVQSLASFWWLDRGLRRRQENRHHEPGVYYDLEELSEQGRSQPRQEPQRPQPPPHTRQSAGEETA